METQSRRSRQDFAELDRHAEVCRAGVVSSPIGERCFRYPNSIPITTFSSSFSYSGLDTGTPITESVLMLIHLHRPPLLASDRPGTEREIASLRLLVAGLVLLLVSVACAPAADPGASPEESGALVAEEAGCLTCHTTDGEESTGPTWQGLFGSEVTLTDGTAVVADEEYLRRAIVDPAAEVVDGYQPVMTPASGIGLLTRRSTR